MGKDLRGKELGVGLSQREDGLYVGRYTNKYGNRVQKVLPKLQEVRQWLAESQYQDEHSNIDFPSSRRPASFNNSFISSSVAPSNTGVATFHPKYFAAIPK